MILNPKKAYEEGWIKGVEFPDQQVQQNGIDVRIAEVHKILTPGKLFKSGKELPATAEMMYTQEKVSEDDPDASPKMVHIEKGVPYALISMESVDIPENVAAMVIMRSTLNRIGVPIHSGLYDSGFRGKIQPTLYPFNEFDIELGSRFAQVIFFRAESAALYKGQYQDQGLTKNPPIERVNRV